MAEDSDVDIQPITRADFVPAKVFRSRSMNTPAAQWLTVEWQAKTTASELQLIRVLLFEKIHNTHFLSLAHKRGWDTMNDTVYCRLAWPKKCIISVKCVNSTTLGDTQRMLGLLGAAPGVVSYFRRKTARCVSRNGPKSDRCHLDNESPNLSGIGLRCVSCNRPQGNRGNISTGD